jgi:hypothetical protein
VTAAIDHLFKRIVISIGSISGRVYLVIIITVLVLNLYNFALIRFKIPQRIHWAFRQERQRFCLGW